MDFPQGTCSEIACDHERCETTLRCTTLVELLAARSAATPLKPVFRFVAGDGQTAATLSYEDLDVRARAIAVQLAESYPSGSRVLLLFAPGLGFVEAYFGCLYAGMIPVPAALPSRKSRGQTLEGLVVDAEPAIVLTSARDRDLVLRLRDSVGAFRLLDVAAVDEWPTERSGSWQRPAVDGASVALLQYTSGSTSSPRGVVVSHANLLANSALIQRAFGTSHDSRGVFWLPLYHDMGLIGGVLQTVYCGGSSVLMAPAAFLQRPRLWLEMISETRATISGGPNIAYEQCVRRIPASERQGLDLSSWKVAFTGAEPIRAETLDEFAAAYARSGFHRESFLPCYGLAEATLMVTAAPLGRAPRTLTVDAVALEQHRALRVAGTNGASAGDKHKSSVRTLVSCGDWQAGQSVLVVRPDDCRPCGEGEVGEIWVGGPSVAREYFRQPEPTQKTFSGQLAGSEQGPYLRTGDLGFLYRGELYVTGRLKDLIIIRGRNFYPQDIERTVERAHPAFRPGHCAVFAAGDEQDRLVVVQEVEPRWRELDPEPALQAICRAVALDHEIEVHNIALIPAGRLPRTSSGKIRRRACCDAFRAGKLETIASWSAPELPLSGTALREAEGIRSSKHPSAQEIQAWLLTRLAARLKMPIAHIDVHTPFVDLAMSSVDAVEITAELERWLGRRLTPTAIYNYPTIAALAQWLVRPVPGPLPTTPPSVSPAPAAEAESMLEELRELSDAELEALIQAEMSKHRD